jgi:histidyl-tRNA synthetase
MTTKIQAIRGMHDILPETIHIWHFIEKQLRELSYNYGYSEIRFPIVEKTELFKRTIGEVTDIVEKEMYTFEDRNGDSLTLRPEGTAGAIRLGLEHGLYHNQTQRFWYFGPMFRHERPQKGRYRQFYQYGLEAIGFTGPDIDLEILAFCWRLWQKLGIQQQLKLQLNSLGTAESRTAHRQQLLTYLQQYRDQLDEDSQRRLETNPLRILDSKDSKTQEIVANAPSLLDFLDDESKQHFATLCAGLTELGIPYEVNPRLVRGLDYYTRTVFEWVTTELGAQGTVCAGGHYDSLVGQLGGQATPGIGLSMGIERLVLLLQNHTDVEQWQPRPTVYLISNGEPARLASLQLAEKIRSSHPQLMINCHCGSGNFKSQFKRADKSGAILALILGDDELSNNQITVKYLREDKPQQMVDYEQILSIIEQACSG